LSDRRFLPNPISKNARFFLIILLRLVICGIIRGMKRIFFITIVLLLTGMVTFAQDVDMSYYTEELNRTDATIFDIFDILEVVSKDNITGIGDFYEGALRTIFNKFPNFRTSRERLAIQDSARIILRGLIAEKQTSAAPLVWRLIQEFDIVQEQNDGLLMNEAMVTLGEIGATEYAPHIILHLENYNGEQTPDLGSRRKIQLGVMGAISAIESLKVPEGIKPVFYASIGWYDPEIRAIAANALPNIMDDPGKIISEIIQSPFNDPSVKYAAWQKLLLSKAPDSSKAEVAAVALEISYSYITQVREDQNILRYMRMSAIDAIRTTRIASDSVYPYLERTYRESFHTPNIDLEEIKLIISTLSALRTNESVDLLTAFLRELNIRRRSGPWGNTEREMMQVLIPAIAVTGTQSQATMQLLSVIQRSSLYTGGEQGWAENALRTLVK